MKQVPLVIVDLLVFVVYAMERANLEARMGVIVTLVSTWRPVKERAPGCIESLDQATAVFTSQSPSLEHVQTLIQCSNQNALTMH